MKRFSAMVRSAALLLVGCICCGAIDMKWTPNGEAPAPFSTKARQQMGIDPQAFAGGTSPATGGGSTLRFNLAMLLSIYLANNWKVVLALQQLLQSLIAPFLGSLSARSAAAAADSERLRLEAARKARVE
ncbi:MAG: hypothetical protein SGPRY_007999, partial [Prymnesium sp.]